MFKRYIFVTALLTSSATAFASAPIDSIGVENNNGKKLIVHKVDAKESYYSISRRYNVSAKDIQTFNNNLALQIGSVIKVPTDIPFNNNQAATKPISQKLSNDGSFDYTVVANDNLNLIAQRFATTSSEIIKLNALTNINLRLGQVLKIPFVKNGSQKPSNKQVVATIPTSETNNTPVQNTTSEHVVKPKEYLGVIARQYGITVDELKAANNLTGNNLQIGQTLKIPVANSTAVSSAIPTQNTQAQVQPGTSVEPKPLVNTEKKAEQKVAVTAPKNNDPSFEHIVARGETIYSIAQRYKLTTYQLTNFNNLTSNELTVGQKLMIRGEKPAQQNVSNGTDNTEVDSASLKSPNLRRPAAVYGLNRVEEKGTGTWISDPDLDPNKMLILHRTAPVGTVIQITNPMTNRSTFAKVVGKFTENETTKDVIIVMTKAVADAVGALDKRFFCNLTYGPKENEK
jgi:peptidoglycan endopeptidase LytF